MPKLPAAKPRRKRRKRLSGYLTEYDDTAIVDKYTTEDGLTYYKRLDGSLYPKHTTISVTESTRRICAILREAGHYNNYDELFLDIALQIVKAKNDPLLLSEGFEAMLKPAIVQAKKDKDLQGCKN